MLLKELGVEFAVIASDAVEAHHEHLTAMEISQVSQRISQSARGGEETP